MQAASMGDHPITFRLGLESNIITPTPSISTIPLIPTPPCVLLTLPWTASTLGTSLHAYAYYVCL